MPEIILKMPGQRDTSLTLPPGTYQAGSSNTVALQLPFPGVSHVHCELIATENSLKVADLGSSNGTFLDNRPVGRTPVEVPPGTDLMLGTVHIVLLPSASAQRDRHAEGARTQPRHADPSARTQPPAPVPPPQPASALPAVSPASVPESKRTDDKPSSFPVTTDPKTGEKILVVSGIPLPARPFVQQIKKRAHAELLARLNMKRLALGGTSEEELEAKARTTIHEIMSEISIPLPRGVTPEKIETELYHEAIGLGALEDLISRSDISEIMVNGPDHVYVEHNGVLYKTDMSFSDDYQVLAAIERIVSPLGRRIDESSPMVDARLKDGSRVNAIIPPLSLVGPTVTIRKFSKVPLTVENLIQFGSITADIAHFLDVCVKLRKNIIISGGTGSGKTTLLNILSGFLPKNERIVTVEDAAELQLRQEHLVRLESRPANIEGKGEVSIRDLVRNCLRMRPDRIVVGECRGGEALDMLQAMNTGHDGSLTTIHANSPRDALARLETLVLMAGFDLPLRAIREQIASAISLIVQINREKDGTRKCVCVSEITKMEGDIITMQDLFVYKQDGWDDQGKMTGHYEATGSIPTFMEDIKRANLDLDISVFAPPKRHGGGYL